jgi:uncharacterized protein YjeT (DUF2065 family)
MWAHFLVAFGLVLVIEGMLPFLNPKSWRKIMLALVYRSDRFLRSLGLLAMLVGLLIIYIIHHHMY